jgi:hypothetical protein
MKLQHLFERKTMTLAEVEPYVDKICRLLFGQPAAPVTDPKRKGEFLGVANGLASIADASGNRLTLTFDNSTASGEFELNSLTPLHIVKGSNLDLEIAKLYKEHDLPSKKKLGYIEKGGDLVLREIHFGKNLDENAINFVMDLIANLKHGDPKKPVKEEEELVIVKKNPGNEKTYWSGINWMATKDKALPIKASEVPALERQWRTRTTAVKAPSSKAC